MNVLTLLRYLETIQPKKLSSQLKSAFPEYAIKFHKITIISLPHKIVLNMIGFNVNAIQRVFPFQSSKDLALKNVWLPFFCLTSYGEQN